MWRLPEINDINAASASAGVWSTFFGKSAGQRLVGSAARHAEFEGSRPLLLQERGLRYASQVLKLFGR